MDDFSVFLPIEKVDAQSGMVWGYASTPSKDLQGEIVPLDAIKAALPDYMKWANIREMHTSSAVGVTKEAHVDAKGLYIGAKITDPVAWKKCKDQVYKGFSIGGSKLEKVGDVVKALSLREISLVDRPANSDCFIGETLVEPIGAILGITRRWYDGDVFVVRTSEGHNLTVTPNHPILTEIGWKRARDVQEGDNVLSCDSGRQLALADNYVQNGPTTIEELSRSFSKNGSVMALHVPISSPDFHGEGGNGQVDIVTSNGDLRDGTKAGIYDKGVEFILQVATLRKMLDGESLPSEVVSTLPDSADSIMSSLNGSSTLITTHIPPSDKVGIGTFSETDPSFIKSLSYGHGIDSISFTQRNDSDSLSVEPYSLFKRDTGARRTTLPDGNVALAEPTEDCRDTDVESMSDSYRSLAGKVKFDKVIHVGSRKFSGHVYNLHTTTNLIVSEGVVSHNCRIDIVKIAGGLAFGGSMENQTSNETLMEKALDTFRTILGMGKIALPELAKAAPEAVPSPVESDELTADDMTELNKILADTDFEKREFSDKQRKHLASQGIALPDGSYPIANVSDLENAVKAFGRASDPEKAKAHIISRAKALNATHLLPADWPGSTKQKESTIMATDLQKRFGAMHKAAIKKADDHVKKASASHGKAVDELEALHKCMGKAADGGDEFEKHLTALSGHMNDIADHHELAHAALGKAMTGWDGEKAETDLGEKPDSENVEELSPRRMTEGEVEGNTFRGAGDSPYSAAAIATMVKAAVAEATAPLIADNAFLKGQMSVIENQPSAGRRPKLFVASSTGDVFPASDGKADFNRMINKSLSEADPNDQRSSEQATARAFGLMCTPGSGFAKSINDPNFKIDLGGN